MKIEIQFSNICGMHWKAVFRGKFIALKRPSIANLILKENDKVGGMILSEFKTYYKATVFITKKYWGKKK